MKKKDMKLGWFGVLAKVLVGGESESDRQATLLALRKDEAIAAGLAVDVDHYVFRALVDLLNVAIDTQLAVVLESKESERAIGGLDALIEFRNILLETREEAFRLGLDEGE